MESNSRPFETFIEVGQSQICKNNQGAIGDVFLSKKQKGSSRVITTLSDGLGSGIKANVLATLTSTMMTKFVAENMPIKKATEVIMNTLPVCRERGISYATFTIADINESSVRIMEYDNPPYILVRNRMAFNSSKEEIEFERSNKNSAPKRKTILHYSSYESRPEDRLIFFSDGVTQAGLGSKAHPFGWGYDNVLDFVLGITEDNPSICARDLARMITDRALSLDEGSAKDDISCVVIYFRKPRDLLIMTGPAINPEKDKEMALLFSLFDGQKIICGGTTSNILARELGKSLKVILKDFDEKVPPMSIMDGADLVTEGIMTLAAVSNLLETNADIEKIKCNAAVKIIEKILYSDRIVFVVGTKINEAHQDPSLPVELEIRRNIVKKIASILSEKYLKEVSITYF